MSSQAVAWAITHRAGGPSAKAVLLSIANFANEYGECWASQKTIAEGAECCVRQLRRVLADLEARGLMRREHRGGEGKGRQTDMIRLCMVELPVIVSAKRRDETQPDKMAASQATGQKVRGASGQDVRGASGHLRGGYRTMESDYPKNPILKKERVSERTQADEVARFIAALRPVLSPVGNNRTKPKQCRMLLPALLATHGFETLLEATKEFYRTPDCRADGGQFQPGLQVIVGDGRLDAFVQRANWDSDGAPDWPRRLTYFHNHGHWPEKWGPPPGQPGYRGPPDEADNTQAAKRGSQT